MDSKKIGMILLATFAMVLIFMGKSKAVSMAVVPQSTIVTDYDENFDYKQENGVWFTRKKSDSANGAWVNLQTSLKPQNYNMVVARLTAFLTSKIQ